MAEKSNYDSAKCYFQNGNFQKSSLYAEKVIDGKVSFDTKVIMKANMFFSKLVSTNSTLDEKTAKNISSLCFGIENQNLKKKVIVTFHQNLCLYQVSKNNFNSAFDLIKIAQEYDDTNRSNEICGSLYLHNNSKPPIMTPFLSIWYNYLKKDYKYILQNIGELYGAQYMAFLAGYSHMLNKRHQKAIEYFNESITNGFRISECLNNAGICSFYLNNMKDAVEFLEKAIRVSSPSQLALLTKLQFPQIPLFNLAEVCGALERTAEQLELLKFYARLESSLKHGSISTLYLLAKITLENAFLDYFHINNEDIYAAYEKYNNIYEEIQLRGIDAPSITFPSEFAYVLNMKGDYQFALKIMPPKSAKTDFEKAVSGHSLWLAKQYQDCDDVIRNIATPESECNRALLSFISSHDKTTISLINNARRESPSDLRIARNASLIYLSRQQTILSGCSIWLTSIGYQLNHQPEYYQDIINQMKTSGKCDPLTLTTLENWKSFRSKKQSNS